MASTLRVLVLCEFSSLNGGERSLLSALDAGPTQGLELMVAAPASGPLAAQLRERQLAHFPFRYDDGRGHRLTVNQRRSQLGQLLDQTDCQVLHANSLATSRLAGPVARRLGIPSLGHLRDIMRISDQAVRDISCHRRLLAVSQATKQWYVDAGLPSDQLHVEYNGVDLQSFRKRPRSGWLHAELKVPDSALLVGSVGQIGLRKGFDVLIDAAQTVLQARADVHFVIAGKRYSQKDESRAFEAMLLAAASRPPLRGHIHFLGQRDDVRELMNEWDLLLHTARQEPLGRVLLEAAASGLPILATDVGGTREIFPVDQECAVLVPPNDAPTIARSLQQLLADATRRQRLGQAARRRAELQFDVRDVGKRLARHYCEIADWGA
jgi:glycosyltransferase involved in cell wall biosynthesis